MDASFLFTDIPRYSTRLEAAYRLPFTLDRHILATGPEQKNTFCLARDGYAFVSQHIGDMDDLSTLAAFDSFPVGVATVMPLRSKLAPQGSSVQGGSRCFCTLPSAVLGNLSRNTTRRGTLNTTGAALTYQSADQAAPFAIVEVVPDDQLRRPSVPVGEQDRRLAAQPHVPADDDPPVSTRVTIGWFGRLIAVGGGMRGGSGRFRGLRLVHTHLRGEALTRDDLTDLALLRLDAVAARRDPRPHRRPRQ